MFLAPALTRRLPASARPLSPVRLLPAAFRRVLPALGCLAVLLLPSLARAQAPGTLDTTFTSAAVGSDFYAFTFVGNGNNQQIFVGGDSGLAYLLTTAGTVNTAFQLEDFGLPLQRVIYTAVQETVLPPGVTSPEILVGGLFGRNSTQITADEPAQNIKRIDPTNGTLDTTFDPGSGANSFVTSILLLGNGNMVVAGEFTAFNKIDHERIVELDNTGATVDGSVFSSTLGFDATVLSLAQQYAADGSGTTNGQILVGGVFSNVNNQTHTKLARINADGSVDGSFNPVFSDRVRVVVGTSDGKILAGGDFETVNGQAVKHLVRLNFDGSLDTTFNALVTTMPAQIDEPVAVNTITPLGDGRYYIGGNFYEINGVPRHYLGRVLADGTVDEFDPGTTLSNAVQQVTIDQATNKVYVTQNRDKSINNIYPASIFRLFGDPQGVSITASVATATSTNVGKFTVARTDGTDLSPIRVYLTRGGTAKNMAKADKPGDYTLGRAPTRSGDIDGQKGFFVTIPAGQESVTVRVKETGTARVGTTVTLTVQPDQSGADDYEIAVGTDPTATVTLE